MEAVSTRCKPFVCQKECLEYVRQLKATECYHGDVGALVRVFLLEYTSSDQRLQNIEWFAKLDSCDRELWSEGYTRPDDDINDVTGAAASTTPVISGLAVALLAATLRVF